MFAIWIIKTTENPSKPTDLPPTGEVVEKSDMYGEEFAGPFDLDTGLAYVTEFNQAAIDQPCNLWAIVVEEREKLKKGQKIKLEAARQGKVKLYTAGHESPLLTTGNPMNDQEKEHLTKLVMNQSYAFDSVFEQLWQLGGYDADNDKWAKPEVAKVSDALSEVQKIHEEIGVALGILH